MSGSTGIDRTRVESLSEELCRVFPLPQAVDATCFFSVLFSSLCCLYLGLNTQDVQRSFIVSLAEAHRADGEAKLVTAVAKDSYVM